MSEKEKDPQSPSSNNKQPSEDLNLSAPVETLSEVTIPDMSENPPMELQENEEKSEEPMCSSTKSESTAHISTTDTLKKPTGNQSPNNNNRKLSELDMDRTEEMSIETVDDEKSTNVSASDNVLSEIKSLETFPDPPIEFQDKYSGNEEKLELMCSPSKKSKLTLQTSASDTLEQSTGTRSPNSKSKLSEPNMDTSEHMPTEALNVDSSIRISSPRQSGKQTIDPLVHTPEEHIQSPDKPSGEVQMDGTGHASNEQASIMDTGAPSTSAGVDQSHICTGTCIHGGARPKTRSTIAASSANQSSTRQGKRSRHWEEVNNCVERMERKLSQADWARNIDYKKFSEETADRIGHGPFVQPTSNSEFSPYLSSLTQVTRMLANLNLDAISEQEPPSQCQEPNPAQVPDQSEERKIHQESTISLDQVPEPRRTIDADEILAMALQKWQLSAEEPNNSNRTNDAESNEERVENVQQEEELPAQNREVRPIPLAPRLFYRVNFNDPYHHFQIEEEWVWKHVMHDAYNSDKYHNQEVLDQAASQLERDGISEDDFYDLYPLSRRMFLCRDEGVEDERTVEEIKERIIQLIVESGYLVAAMLYMRMYYARNSRSEFTADESTDSGKIVHMESEPQFDYKPLREYVNIKPESSDDSNSPKDDSSEIQFLASATASTPDSDGPVNILLPLDQIPIRANTPSSQDSLLNKSEPTRPSTEMKHKAVLVNNQSLSLDNTSNDASPISQDDDTCQEDKTFGQLFNLLVRVLFLVTSDLKSAEEEITGNRNRSEENNQDTTSRTPDSTKSRSGGKTSGTQESGDKVQPIEMSDSGKSSSSGCCLEELRISESPSRTKVEESKNQVLPKEMSDFGETGSCEPQGAFGERRNEPACPIEVDGPKATLAEDDKAKSSSEECVHSKEKDSASGDNLNKDKGDEEKLISGLEEDKVRESYVMGQEVEPGDDLSMDGQSKKRKDHSDSEEESERVVKRGHMEN